MAWDPSAFITGLGTVSLGTLVTVAIRIHKVLARLELRLQEHDMMWFDYCDKHNIRLSATARRFNGSPGPAPN